MYQYDIPYAYYAALSGLTTGPVYALSHHEEKYFAKMLGTDAGSWVGTATAFYTTFSGLPVSSSLKDHVDTYFTTLTTLPPAWVTALKDDAYALLGLSSAPSSTPYPSSTLYPSATLYPGA